MTIQFLISTEGYFGAENMLLTLASALMRRGCCAIVTVFRDSRQRGQAELATRARARGLHVEMLDCAGRRDLGAVIRLRKMLARIQPDVLHSHGYKADVYGFLASWRTGTTLVSTCHNWSDPSPRMRTYARLDRLVLRRFSRVVAVSSEVERLLVRSGVSNSIVVQVINGVDIQQFESAKPVLRSDRSASECLIGFVGRFIPEKGGANLLLAAKQLLSSRPKTRFIFVGDGPSRLEWQEMACRLGISAQVDFLGIRSDMAQIYASLDVVVLPSFNEAMPMCLLEAMAARKAVVATSVGDIPRIIVPGETGLLIQPGDSDSLCSAILTLVDGAEFRSRLAEAGYQRAKGYFSAEAMAANYLSIYSQATRTRPTCPSVKQTLEMDIHE